MNLYVVKLALILGAVGLVGCHQRAPPGVNPNTYQQHLHSDGQPPPVQPHFRQDEPQHEQQQQQQHQQLKHQQPKHQHQQPKQQQQQQQQHQHQQQQQQQQQHEVRGHGQGPNPAVLHKDITHETEHMKEHMDMPIDTSSMSEQELQFHYFKMHDTDGNNKLDGCELVKSLIHWHDGDSHDDHDHEPPPHYEDSQLAAFIDPVLKADDINNDGMIDYAEFIAAQIKTRSGLRQPLEVSI